MQPKKSIKVFLASSNELAEDRDAFALMIERKNKLWALTDRPNIDLKMWEICSESVSATRTQDEYNAIIKNIDIVVVLVRTKVGKYTSEEFQLAKRLFIQKGKPTVIVYQKKSDRIEDSLTEYLNQFSETGKEYFHGQYEAFAELENKFLNEFDLYLNKNRTSKLSEKDKNRIELLEGLERRYEKRIQSKMDSELNFQLDLILEYTKAGTSEEYVQDYFVEAYDTKSWESFNELFYEFETKLKRLLILGEPGAGKTVLLLKFAKRLIEKAKINFDYPLPIILNLATWRNEYQDFKTWLADNLVYAAGEYGTAKKYAKELVEENNMLLLLDGLDEIPEADRDSCLEKLWEYIKQNENTKANIADYPQLIICSRKNEYVQLPQNAPVKASLYIAPLKADDLIKKLESWKTDNASAKVLLNRIKAYPNIANELSSSFDVHLALHLANEYDFKDFSKENLLETFIQTELNKIDGTKSEKSKSYLDFLASKLNQSKKSIYFELTDMQPEWGSNRNSFKYYYIVFCVLFSLFFSFVWFQIFQIANKETLSFNFIEFQKAFLETYHITITIGFFIYLSPNQIDSLEIKKIEFKQWNTRYNEKYLVYYKLIFKLTIILLICKGISIFFGSIYNEGVFETENKNLAAFITIASSPLSGVFSGFLLGHFLSFVNSFVVSKRIPDVKYPYTRLISSFISELLIIYFSLFFPLSLLTLVQNRNCVCYANIDSELYIPFSFFLFSFTITILKHPIVRHFILRFLLVTNGTFPFRICNFLNKVSQTGLMDKDGGQWRFRHQLIQDWFAGHSQFR